MDIFWNCTIAVNNILINNIDPCYLIGSLRLPKQGDWFKVKYIELLDKCNK